MNCWCDLLLLYCCMIQAMADTDIGLSDKSFVKDSEHFISDLNAVID